MGFANKKNTTHLEKEKEMDTKRNGIGVLVLSLATIATDLFAISALFVKKGVPVQIESSCLSKEALEELYKLHYPLKHYEENAQLYHDTARVDHEFSCKKTLMDYTLSVIKRYTAQSEKTIVVSPNLRALTNPQGNMSDKIRQALRRDDVFVLPFDVLWRAKLYGLNSSSLTRRTIMYALEIDAARYCKIDQKCSSLHSYSAISVLIPTILLLRDDPLFKRDPHNFAALPTIEDAFDFPESETPTLKRMQEHAFDENGRLREIPEDFLDRIFRSYMSVLSTTKRKRDDDIHPPSSSSAFSSSSTDTSSAAKKQK